MLDRNPLLYSIQDSYLIYSQLSIRFFFRNFIYYVEEYRVASQETQIEWF